MMLELRSGLQKMNNFFSDVISKKIYEQDKQIILRDEDED